MNRRDFLIESSGAIAALAAVRQRAGPWPGQASPFALTPPGFSTLVVGVGNVGGVVLDRVLQAGIPGVKYLSLNVDRDALRRCSADHRILLMCGPKCGLDCHARREDITAAMEGMRPAVDSLLAPAHLVLIIAGLGGRMGTTAAPIVASWAQGHGALTVGIVTEPFAFEGRGRIGRARWGLRELRTRTDAIVLVPCTAASRRAGARVRLSVVMERLQGVLLRAAETIASVPSQRGPVCSDLADLRAVFGRGRWASVGVGHAPWGAGTRTASRRPGFDAARCAIRNMLDLTTLCRPRAALVGVEGSDLSSDTVGDALHAVYASCGQDVAVVATGIENAQMRQGVRVTSVLFGGYRVFPAASVTM